jgi:putative endonuclease
MARAWLSEVRDRPWAAELRFDAVGVTLDPRGELVRLDHLEAAF